MYKLFFDGSVRNGVAYYGYVIYRNDKKIYSNCGVLLHEDNSSIAEYVGLICGLKRVIELKGPTKEAVHIFGDSLLIIQHLKKKQIKSKRLLPVFEETKLLLLQLNWSIAWIPSKNNSEAHKMARSINV